MKNNYSKEGMVTVVSDGTTTNGGTSIMGQQRQAEMCPDAFYSLFSSTVVTPDPSPCQSHRRKVKNRTVQQERERFWNLAVPFGGECYGASLPSTISNSDCELFQPDCHETKMKTPCETASLTSLLFSPLQLCREDDDEDWVLSLLDKWSVLDKEDEDSSEGSIFRFLDHRVDQALTAMRGMEEEPTKSSSDVTGSG